MKLWLTEVWWMKSCRKLADKVGAAGYLTVVPDIFYGDAYNPVGEDLRAGFTEWLPKHLPVIFCTTPFVTYLVFHYLSLTQHKIWTHMKWRIVTTYLEWFISEYHLSCVCKCGCVCYVT
jgi:hypothetical protein